MTILQSMQHKKKKPVVRLVYICCSEEGLSTGVENIHALAVFVDANDDHLTGSLLHLLLFKAIFWFKRESFYKRLQPRSSLFGANGLRHGPCVPGRVCFHTSCTRTVPENTGTVPMTTFSTYLLPICVY